MEEKQRIKITIAGKVYALRVETSQEEEILRLAAKKIDETINRLKK